MEIRTKCVVFYEEGIRSTREIGGPYNIFEMTVRRWVNAHREDLDQGLRPKRPGRNGLLMYYPWRWNDELSGSKRNILQGAGAHRIKHQFDLPCS